jgi:uncharacterized protein (TIGR03435 family)
MILIGVYIPYIHFAHRTSRLAHAGSMKPWIACVCLISSCLVFGQKSPEKLAFEVASIKPAEPMPMGQMRIGMNVDAGMLRYTNVALKECIRVAYRVKEFQIQGPDWIGSARFDITAKLPDGASEDQVPEMMQALLADRFKLTLHRDTKEHAIYALVAGKGGPKLKPAEVPTDGVPAGNGPAPRGKPRNAMMMQMDGAGAHLKAPSVSLPNLAEMMSRFSERPVVDMTGIEGMYDFDLVFSPETMRLPGGGRGPMPPGGGEHADAPAEPAVSIYESVQKYGLKMEPRKAPMEILIVDHIEKTPTEN